MKVGIRNIKSRFSKFLRQVKNGNVITITDRGQAVAILSPIYGTSHLPSGLTHLMKKGVLKGNGLRPKGLEPRMRLKKGMTASRVILADRNDRIS